MTVDADDMDEAEMLHLAFAAYLLEAREPSPRWLEEMPPMARMALGAWRRESIGTDWNKRLPLYIWLDRSPS